jgi:hypothetical protein
MLNLMLTSYSLCTVRTVRTFFFVGVHWNQFFKFRPEPDLAGTGEKFRPERPTRIGTDSLSDISLYVTLSAARQSDTFSHQ